MALFLRDQGLIQRDLSFVNFDFRCVFQFKCSSVCSGKVYMSGTKQSQNSVGTVYPF